MAETFTRVNGGDVEAWACIWQRVKRRHKKRRLIPRTWSRGKLWVGDRQLLLLAKATWGISCFAVVVGGGYCDPAKWFTALKRVKTMKRRKASAATSDAMHLAPIETRILDKHHPLVKHCAETKYDEGDARQVGWWTVKTMGSAWVIEIKDPDTCSRLVVVQATLDDALTLAALLLDSEEAPWEPDPWLTAARAKKKK